MADSSGSRPPGEASKLSSQDDSSTSSGPRKCCTACGEPTKGHLGPCGSSSCLLGLVTKLTARVESLENIGRRREEQFAQLEQLSLQRQEGLLATIKALEEEVDDLKSTVVKLESKGAQGSHALNVDFLPTVTRSADCEHLLKPSNCSSDGECKVVSSGSCMYDDTSGSCPLVRGNLALGLLFLQF